MVKIKVLSIFGTRPEAIKMAPLVIELEKNKNIESVVCVTAQHREMLDQVLSLFKINPDYDLNIMEPNQTLTGITSRALAGLEAVLKKSKPDLILVHGDTTTTFVAALASFYSKSKIGHVEAGLRTYDKYQPYPEEMNRKLTTVIADLHFAPTKLSKNNLLKENVDSNQIFITGNTAIDCLKTTIQKDYIFTYDLLNNLDYKNKRVITMTAHRRENLGEPLVNICKAVSKLADENEDLEVVYAVHFNPAVRDIAYKFLGNHPRIHLIEPLDIRDMHNLMNLSYLVMTDSGGLQEEVPSMGKPVLVLRNVTERPEGIDAGTLKLAGVNENEIYEAASLLLNNKKEYEKMAKAKNPFGDGNASIRIVNSILHYFGITSERPEDYEI